MIVNVEVRTSRRAFSIAGGYSTADGFIAEASVEERNFLGRGQFVRLGGTFGQRSRGVNFSFTEPFLLDYRLAGGFDLFWRQVNRSSWQPFESRSYGGTLRSASRSPSSSRCSCATAPSPSASRFRTARSIATAAMATT